MDTQEQQLSVNAIQDEIIEEFALFEDPLDKVQYLIDVGEQLPPLDDRHKTEDNEVKGCQSKVWLHAEPKDGRLYFEADSDSPLVKGVIAQFVRVLSGQKIDAILDADLYFVDKVDLKSHLTSKRSNGITGMIKQMKIYALAYKAKSAA